MAGKQKIAQRIMFREQPICHVVGMAGEVYSQAFSPALISFSHQSIKSLLVNVFLLILSEKNIGI